MIYTIDNPKSVKDAFNFRGVKTFTGVVKDKYNTVAYYLNGNRHREGGPAITFADGEKHWWLNGKRHRTDGPATENANGDKCWYLNDKCHREDGPACEMANGRKYFYLNDVYYGTNENFTNESWIRFVTLRILT